MLITKGDHMLDETKLDKAEAESFIRCMEDELQRHIQAQSEAALRMTQTSDLVINSFYSFGITRHKEDIEMIQQTIYYLRNKHNL